MQPRFLALVALLSGGVLIGSLVASRAAQRTPSFAAPSGLPSAGVEILEARPFVLDQPYVHEWRAEKPLVAAGFVLVLAVDPDLARARDAYEAVLYVGDQTAERCNAPEDGGHLIVLVPAPVAADGSVRLDLDTAPIWFGSLELPERVNAARIADELALARSNGIGPARRSAAARLRSGADDTIHCRTREDLGPYLADWIEQYSPAEVDRATWLRTLPR